MAGGRNLIKITVFNNRIFSEHRFETDVILVGRDENSPLCINHPDVSRRHLTIMRRANALWIEDQGSSNGTYLNGEKLTAKIPRTLHPGKKVLLGSDSSTVYLQAEVEWGVMETSSPELEKVAFGREETVVETSESLSRKRRHPGPPPLPPRGTVNTTSKSPPRALAGTQAGSTKIAAKSTPTLAPASAPAPGVMHAAEIEVEKILQRARREADDILKRAQIAAEDKYRSVFEEAQTALTNGEAFYRERVQKAYQAAEEIYEDARAATAKTLEDNRKICDDQRREASDRIADMRRKAKAECESLLAEAEAVGKQLKEKRLEEANTSIERLEQELKQAVRDEMVTDRLNQEEALQKEREDFDEEMKALHETRDELNKQLDEIEKQHSDLNRTVSTLTDEKESLMKISKDMSEVHGSLEKQSETLKKEIAQLELDLYQKQKDVMACTKDIETLTVDKKIADEALTQLKASCATFKKDNGELESQFRDLSKSVSALKLEEKQLQDSTAGLTSTKKGLDADLISIKKQLETTRGDLEKSKKEFESLSRKNQEMTENRDAFSLKIEKELAELKLHYEQQKEKYKRDDEEHLAYLNLETSKRAQKVERDFLAEITRRKSSVVKEILISLESSSKVIGAHLSDWRKESDQIEQNVQLLLEGQILNLKSESGIAPQKINVVARRRMERLQHFAQGAIVTLVLVAIGYVAFERIQGPSPLARQVASEAQARKQDLLARRFNPPKEQELKASYTDAVIYTNRFVEIYTSDDFQKQWTKAATKHLLKLWKVDEDSSLQALSISLTLVRALQERKEKLHPDFLKDGLQKMKDAEGEALRRMADVLGSSVRVESLKRFEKEFFLRYRDRGEVLQGGEDVGK
jgi:pSer/pThr/pTyr-binding forkhead associated (FHA) protein/myosin heavy subunit